MPNTKEMLKTILEQGNLNQFELAQRLNVSPAQITRWLGGADPKLSNYLKIREIYNGMTKK